MKRKPVRLKNFCQRLLASAAFLFASALSTMAQEAAPKASPPATPQQKLLDQLRALVAREPAHVGALYTAARVAAGSGDHAQAADWLDKLEKVGMDDALDDDDFSAFSKTPAYLERAARFAKAAPPIGKALSWAETSCADLLPEGTAWDAKRGALLVSSGRQRAVFAIERSGACKRLTALKEERLLAVLGMMVDTRTDSLWVATTAAPFMIDATPADANSARLTRIDLATGNVLASHRVGEGVMLNDLTMNAGGVIFVTDSRGGRIFRLRPGAEALEPLVTNQELEGPNGIVALDDGDLLVADFHGLARIRVEGKDQARVTRLSTPGNLYLGGIDGLARSGAQIIAIQNLVGRSRIWSITLDAKGPGVASARVLLRGHPDFLNPTTGAIAGRQFLFVADTKLQNPLPGGALTPLPQGRKGHRILAVDVGALE